MSINRLAEETSPYLLAHKDNPVHWYAWGADALKAAEENDKPILLSIGYSACHWCHVMNRDSFSDPETASVMNDNFICVQVDREERPDVDKYFQTAAQLMGHNGGWPLTVFLTPKAAPYFVGGFFPKEAQNKQPAFKTALQDIANIYKTQGQQAAQNGEKVTTALQKQWSQSLEGKIDPRMIDILSIHTAQRFDIFYGGLTGAPKFLQVPAVELLWRGYLRTGAAQYAQLTETTLHNMCLGGVYDHIGGGFHRYAVDERWIMPHFEKMTAENAAMVDILTLVGQHTHEELYRTRVEEVLGWMTREMQVEGAFATSQDADTDGIEGNYYLWSEEEIDAALTGTFVQRFKDVFEVRKQGPLMGRNILQRLGAPYPLSDADEALIKRQRSLLFKARSEARTQPKRDDKILADVNGMAIHAFAFAGMVQANPEWLRTAITAFDYMVKNMDLNGKLVHSRCEGENGPAGFAEDYAQMIRAALQLWEATSNSGYLDCARTWTKTMNEAFWDGEHGGYFDTEADVNTPFARIRTALDQALPSANSIMVDNLAKLGLITGDTSYQEKAGQLIASFARELPAAFLPMANFLNSLENVLTGLQIVIIGPRNSGKTQELIAAVLNNSLPTRLMMVVDPETALPEGHPAFGKTMENGLPTAYICQHKACMAPITNASTLGQVLKLPAKPQQGRPQ